MSWQILTRQDPDLLPESDSIDMSLQNFENLYSIYEDMSLYSSTRV